VPLYEYECQKCSHRFERIVKFSDAPLKKCPECGGKVEQLISAPAVQFKGSGWYVTDYANKGAGAKGNESGDGAGKAQSKESSDGKSAPAANKAESGEKAEAKTESKGKSEAGEKQHRPKRGHARR